MLQTYFVILMSDQVLIESFTKFSLNILSWNINNFCSRVIGNKLSDPDFLRVTHGYDIVGLVETHSTVNDDLHIAGFGKPFVKLRPRNRKMKAFGGLAVFVKQEVLDSIKVTQVSTACPDILWLKLDNKNKRSNQSKPVFLGFVYVSPTHKGNKCTTNPLDGIQEDCLAVSGWRYHTYG